MSGKDLIVKFLCDLSETQKYAEHRAGTLDISVGYLMDKEVVEVSVIQARNLPGTGKWSKNCNAIQLNISTSVPSYFCFFPFL